MKQKICYALIIAVAISLIFAGSSNVQADEFPEEDIHWLVPFTSGSGADIFARNLARAAEEHLGVSIAVENRAGGAGAVAVSYALTQPTDGHTVFTHSSTLPIAMAGGQLPFSMDVIQPIASINADPLTLSVPVDSPFETLDDFVSYAKENPGELLIGGTATGGTHNVMWLHFENIAGIETEWVAYPGGSEAVMGLLAKETDALVTTTSNAGPQVDGGESRYLGVGLTEEEGEKMGVPTFKGQNYDFEAQLWRGVFAIDGVPEERIEVLQEALRKATQEAVFTDYMEDFEQFDFFLEADEFGNLLNETYEMARDILDAE